MSDRHRRMLNALLDLEEGLTAWEIDFLESLMATGRHDLSPKQAEVLERLAEQNLKAW